MHRPLVAALAAGALLAALLVATPAAAAPALAPLSFDRSDKAGIAAAYRRLVASSERVPIGWTGSTKGCVAGTTSEAQELATKRVVNFARRITGLTTVGFDDALSAKAQQAALVYAAEKKLAHEIPDSWACATDAAQQAGTHSDIALGAGGAKAALLYLADPGASNVVAGHRRWILNPAAKRFGSGSTPTSNALWVIGSTRAVGAYADPAWVAWPSNGYFPSQLEPDGLWSLSAGGTGDVDFSAATVVVERAGKRLPVTIHPPVDGYGRPTLTWTVGKVVVPSTGKAAVYRVTVRGIERGAATVSRSYVVRLFDATKVR